MRKPLTPALLLTVVILFTGAVGFAHAQKATSGDIKKIEPALVNSPEIAAGNYRKSGQNRPPQWLEIDVTFDFPLPDKKGPKFADEITVNYYILLNNKGVTEDGKQTFLTGSVSHDDVRFDKGLHSSAFVSPQTLLRFFDGKSLTNPMQAVMDVGVTISANGTVIAERSWKGDKGWWENSAAFSEVTGRVLAKDATPFANLSWDYYLPPKPKAGL